MKRKILQKIANLIYDKAKNASTETDQNVWLNMGFGLDRWCVGKGIYLD